MKSAVLRRETDKLAAQGFKVYEIESDDDAYEVEMVYKNGTPIDTHVHPATGEILRGYDD
ncbi:MAG: PepSY domain-containing protein [Methyloceanibacter sp.]